MNARQPVVEIEGGRELRKALKQAQGDLADFKAVHVQVAEHVIAYSDDHNFTPVRTGAMRDTQRAQKTGASAGIRVGSGKVFYAPFVYDGTRTIPANPWLHKAAEASREEWEAIYADAVEDILAKAVKGMA